MNMKMEGIAFMRDTCELCSGPSNRAQLGQPLAVCSTCYSTLCTLTHARQMPNGKWVCDGCVTECEYCGVSCVTASIGECSSCGADVCATHTLKGCGKCGAPVCPGCADADPDVAVAPCMCDSVKVET